MRNILRISALVTLTGWWTVAAAEETFRPRLVAPGAGLEIAVVESRCPTFHWSGVPAAERYELVLYRAREDASQPRELYRTELPADVRSWTPSTGRCLDAAGRYAWSVGAVVGAGEESWSEVGVFEVAARPSIAEVEEAMVVLRRYLRQDAEWSGPDLDALGIAGDPGDVTPWHPATSAVRGEPVRSFPGRRVPEDPSTFGPVALSLEDDLRVTSGDTPTLRLEQDGSEGWPAYSWEIASNEQKFHIRDITNATRPFGIRAGAPDETLLIRSSGTLVLQSSHDGNASNQSANVAWFENTDSDGGGGDVLALKINEASAESNNNFITFLNSNNSSLGAIEGDGAGGGTTASSGADYAEFLERLEGEAPMAAGDVAGLFGRRVSRATAGADRVMVISTAPIVLGNDPGRERRERWEKVALLGQAPVRATGPVRAGDLLVASGRGDGTAVARRPAALAVDELATVLGRALEGSEDSGEKKVLALVGTPDQALLGQMMKSWEKALLERLGAAAGDEPAAAAGQSALRSSVAPSEVQRCPSAAAGRGWRATRR